MSSYQKQHSLLDIISKVQATKMKNRQVKVHKKKKKNLVQELGTQFKWQSACLARPLVQTPVQPKTEETSKQASKQPPQSIKAQKK